MKTIIKILSVLFASLLLFIAVGVLYEGYFGRWVAHPFFWWFAVPFFVGGILFKKYLPQASFYATFRHELCHWFFALVSLNKPAALNVYAKGGGSYMYYGRSNYFIILSPYFFPLISVVLLLISLFFTKPSALYFMLIGIVFAFESVSMLKDYHPGQTDFQEYGKPFSYVFSAVMYFHFAFGLLVVLFNGWKGYWDYLSKVFNTAMNLIF